MSAPHAREYRWGTLGAIFNPEALRELCEGYQGNSSTEGMEFFGTIFEFGVFMREASPLARMEVWVMPPDVVMSYSGPERLFEGDWDAYCKVLRSDAARLLRDFKDGYDFPRYAMAKRERERLALLRAIPELQAGARAQRRV